MSDPGGVNVITDAFVPALTDFGRLTLMEWENTLLGRRLARVEGLTAARAPGEAAAALRRAERRARAVGIQLLITRVPAADTIGLRALQRAGFLTTDVGVTFARELDTVGPASDTERLRDASPEDAEALQALVTGMFTNSYYYTSGFFSRAEADRIHHAWITNCVHGRRGEHVLLATSAAGVLGFVTCRPLGDGLGVIDLIGVGGNHTARGVGKSLLRGAADVFGRLGCRRVRVRTQVTNLAAVNLYVAAGYRLVEADTTLMKSLAKESHP